MNKTDMPEMLKGLSDTANTDSQGHGSADHLKNIGMSGRSG